MKGPKPTFVRISEALLKHRPFHPFRKLTTCQPVSSNCAPLTEGAADDELYLPFARTNFNNDSTDDLAVSNGSSVDDMGKSNKFDFSNRPNSGVKLGNSIASALIKEADKLITKARKQSTDSSAASEKDLSSHCIDLQAPKKALGDDGLAALADGLESALRRGNDLASLALEDLNLSENGITVASLARLAPIIELAKHDLKTLVLFDNNFAVTTDVEAEQWELFLTSFRGCLKLRRLDLGDNPSLGRRAIEIFARIHINEPVVTPTRLSGDGSVLSLTSEIAENETPDDQQPDEDIDSGDEALAKSLSNAKMLKRRCGLRSVPYITLSNTGIDDAAGLWLSYVLEDHYFPSQLTDDLNGIHTNNTIKVYQQDTDSTGVDWSGNILGKEGLGLLHKAEALRTYTLLDDPSVLADSLLVEDEATGDDSTREHSASINRRLSRGQPSNRRASIRSIHTADGGEHEASELESARRKIQRHLIEHHSPACMDLWQAALKIVAGSRSLLIVAPKYRKYFAGEAVVALPSPDALKSRDSQKSQPSRADSGKTLSIDTAQAKAVAGQCKTSYAKTLSGMSPGTKGEPELAITETTNSPTTPKIIFKPHRKGAFSEGADLPAVTERLNHLILRDDLSARFVKYQVERTQREANAVNMSERIFWRDTGNVTHLPQNLVDRIFGFVLPNNGIKLLSEEQRRAAFCWGIQRRSLKTAEEWKKKDMATRAWLLLDSIKCLAYAQ
ncbi:hypothetical protein KC323_g677 [Hortaea werneckii]|uniref:Uncharacterized protein n=1 Tax=Hortaea werneckii TaxID=91943 RepID=A0A3M7EWT4_HORWE|nr:hypothetical protein KC323_g677 [Hortaea werneckii]KAI7357936.1 hypothetical protein KC320_g1408 [Hortaea werneckii]RMY80981.1 hypothetical protein D0862_12523 [Hortaea werneckii]